MTTACWLMTICLTTSSHPTTIRLRSEAVVVAPTVALGDVADVFNVEPAEVARLSRTVLGNAPETGRSMRWNMQEVKKGLENAGVRTAFLEFSGSQSVEVRSAANGVPSGKGARTPVANVESRHRELVGDPSGITAQIEASIRNFGAWPMDELKIEVDHRLANDWLSRRGAMNWQLRLPEQWTLGSQRVALEVPIQGDFARFQIDVVIQRERRALVACHRITRGATITAEDIRSATVTVTRDDGNILVDPALAIGKTATRSLEPHQPISSRDLKAPAVVFRGSQVTVYVRFQTATIEMTAQAKEDGAVGEWISVVNPTTQKPLDSKVRVVGFQTAEMPTSLPAEATSAKTSKTEAVVQPAPRSYSRSAATAESRGSR